MRRGGSHRGPRLQPLPVTLRQSEILSFIRRQVDSGRVPSVREIQAEFGFASPNAVRDHLKALEAKGLIVRQPRQHRAIVVTEAGT